MNNFINRDFLLGLVEDWRKNVYPRLSETTESVPIYHQDKPHKEETYVIGWKIQPRQE